MIKLIIGKLPTRASFLLLLFSGIFVFLSSQTVAQTISYITPDEAAGGMSVAVEFIGPAGNTGNFGADGFYASGTKVKLLNQIDTNRVVLGQSVVSWNGHMVQAMLLIKRTASLGPVSLVVANGVSTSSPVSFQIVLPLHFGTVSANAVIGEGALGGRSHRNTLVIDSLIQTGGTLTCSTLDPDLSTNGNQTYLPLRILSQGPVRLMGTLDARGRDASLNDGGRGNCGGGGGGGGMPSNGGEGFTGGGGVGESGGGGGRHGGASSGEFTTTGNYYDGGKSLNGVLGGQGTEHNGANNDEGGAGGTGHPFGTSGQHGIWNTNSLPGGYGAGSGGGSVKNSVNYGGGGAGYASNGAQGSGSGDNSGQIVGNKMLVPFAGGSGGGSGNITYFTFFGVPSAGNGGGGGAAIDITSFASVTAPSGNINVSGGNATGGSGTPLAVAAGGGGGSGGAVSLSARDSIAIGNSVNAPSIFVGGGSKGSGSGGNDGGDGGKGRVRLDGRVSNQTGNANTANFYDPTKDYIGAAIQSCIGTKTMFTVTGYAKGWLPAGETGTGVDLYYRFPSSTIWNVLHTVTASVPNSYTAQWKILNIPRSALLTDTQVYLTAYAANATAPGSGPYKLEPQYVMSHVSGMIGSLPGIPKILVQTKTIDFGKIRVGKCSKDTSITIFSQGSGLLTIDSVQVLGPDSLPFTVRKPIVQQIDPGFSDVVKLAFCPNQERCFTNATLRIFSNDISQDVSLQGCGIAPHLTTAPIIDFGSVKLTACKDTTVHVVNNGTDTLTITRESIPDARFTILSALPIKVKIGGDTLLAIRYCPTDTNSVTTHDTIISDALTNPSLVTLIARAKVGVLSSLAAIDFGSVGVGSCSDSTIALGNTGNDTLVIPAAPIMPANFKIVTGTFPLTIAPDSSYKITIEYCPLAAVTDNGTATIAPAAPVQKHDILLSGRGVIGILSIPSSVDFECIEIGTSIRRTLMLRNSGAGTVQSIQTAVSGSPDLQVVYAPSSIAPNSGDSLVVLFNAKTLGNIGGSVAITDKAGQSLSIPFTAHVTTAPKLIVLDTLINFDTVNVGDTVIKCIRLTNYSCLPSTLDSVAITATSPGVFYAIQAVLPLSLSDSAVRTICIRFTPHKNQLESGQLVLLGAKDTVRGPFVKGQGASPIVTVRPRTLDFGDVLVNTTSPAQTFYVINTGIAPTSVTLVTLGGTNPTEFTLAGAPSPIKSNDSIAYVVQFKPLSVGVKSAYALLTVNGVADTVFLTGRGVNPGILVTHNTIDFGLVDVQLATPPQRTFAITNTGTAPLTVQPFAITGDPSFTVATNPTLPKTLNASSDSIFVTVTFKPLSIGVKNATLNVNNTSADQPTVSLTGEGIQAILTPSVDTINFGTVQVGGTVNVLNALKLTNTGYKKSLRIQSISIAGTNPSDFTVNIPPPSSLAPTEFRLYDGAFQPTQVGLREADLIVQTDIIQPANSIKKVHLIGNAIQSIASISLQLDTVNGRPGQFVDLPLKTPTNVTTIGTKLLRFRVTFDPMALDLNTVSLANTLFAGGSDSIHTYSIGDKEITLMAPQPIKDSGVLATLRLEILGGSHSVEPVRLLSATVGKNLTSVQSLSDGIIHVAACDTNEHLTISNGVKLSQNSPNPFADRSTIALEVLQEGDVNVTIYNTFGEVARTVLARHVTKGSYNIVLDASSLASGIYRCVVEWSDGIRSQRDFKMLNVLK